MGVEPSPGNCWGEEPGSDINVDLMARRLGFEALLIPGWFQGELTPPLSPVSTRHQIRLPPQTRRVTFKCSRRKKKIQLD